MAIPDDRLLDAATKAYEAAVRLQSSHRPNSINVYIRTYNDDSLEAWIDREVISSNCKVVWDLADHLGEADRECLWLWRNLLDDWFLPPVDDADGNCKALERVQEVMERCGAGRGGRGWSAVGSVDLASLVDQFYELAAEIIAAEGSGRDIESDEAIDAHFDLVEHSRRLAGRLALEVKARAWNLDVRVLEEWASRTGSISVLGLDRARAMLPAIRAALEATATPAQLSPKKRRGRRPKLQTTEIHQLASQGWVDTQILAELQPRYPKLSLKAVQMALYHEKDRQEKAQREDR